MAVMILSSMPNYAAGMLMIASISAAAFGFSITAYLSNQGKTGTGILLVVTLALLSIGLWQFSRPASAGAIMGILTGCLIAFIVHCAEEKKSRDHPS